jgi:hypothetical protein
LAGRGLIDGGSVGACFGDDALNFSYTSATDRNVSARHWVGTLCHPELDAGARDTSWTGPGFRGRHHCLAVFFLLAQLRLVGFRQPRDRYSDREGYIDATADQTGHVLLENGLEWDYIVPWSWGGNAMSASIYTVWQHYFDAVRLDAFSVEEIGLVDMYKLGMAFGFRESVTILRFIPIHRVGISIGKGNTLNGSNIKSITLNLGFPLSYQR